MARRPTPPEGGTRRERHATRPFTATRAPARDCTPRRASQDPGEGKKVRSRAEAERHGGGDSPAARARPARSSSARPQLRRQLRCSRISLGVFKRVRRYRVVTRKKRPECPREVTPRKSSRVKNSDQEGPAHARAPVSSRRAGRRQARTAAASAAAVRARARRCRRGPRAATRVRAHGIAYVSHQRHLRQSDPLPLFYTADRTCGRGGPKLVGQGEGRTQFVGEYGTCSEQTVHLQTLLNPSQYKKGGNLQQ